jgi:hypothetical protein
MDPQYVIAIIVIVAGLTGLVILFRAADLAPRQDAATQELKRARRRLAAIMAALDEAKHGSTRRAVTRRDVRGAVESIGNCVAALKRVVPEPDAAATLASIERSAASLTTIVSTLEETGSRTIRRA